LYEKSKPGCAYYICSPSGKELFPFINTLKSLNIWRHTLVWVKDSFVMGRSDYHYRHEVVLYGWKEGAAHKWVGDRKQDTVLEFERPKRSEEHPTMKPIKLITKMLSNSTNENDLICDPFGGSGSTLLAAEQINRQAYLCEINPKYCAVTISRWQNLTGEKAVLIND
jgi:DNA modification methylase